jgi:tetratricopeptide (TPR) repeat protein
MRPRSLCFPASLAAWALAWVATHNSVEARTQSTRVSACRDSLWGCSPAVDPDGAESNEPARVRYDRLLAQARRALASLRNSSPAAAAELIKDTLQKLTDATALLPDDYEAHSLLGQLELERGRLVAAGVSLRRAEALFLHPRDDSGASLLLPPPSLEHRDPALALALALLHAQEGDLATALRRYQRLYDSAAHSQRLLYRMADVLMALGRLEDATALYEAACGVPRSFETPAVDGARACLGAMVALDRGGRMVPGTLLRRARQVDRGPRTGDLADFLTPWERDYSRALLLPPGCERKLALTSYLRGAAGTAPATYLGRAEAHLQRLQDLICAPPASPAAPAARPPQTPPPAELSSGR